MVTRVAVVDGVYRRHAEQIRVVPGANGLELVAPSVFNFREVDEEIDIGELVVRCPNADVKLSSVPVSILGAVRVQGGSEFLHLDADFSGGEAPSENPPNLRHATVRAQTADDLSVRGSQILDSMRDVSRSYASLSKLKLSDLVEPDGYVVHLLDVDGQPKVGDCTAGDLLAIEYPNLLSFFEVTAGDDARYLTSIKRFHN